MNLNTYVNFRGTCAEAFRYYEKHLGGQITSLATHAQSPVGSPLGADWQDKVLHGRIVIGDSELMGADVPNAEPMRSAYLTLRVESIGEAERVFAALADGGSILMPIQEPSLPRASVRCATGSASTG
jgi:PhnB protein